MPWLPFKNLSQKIWYVNECYQTYETVGIPVERAHNLDSGILSSVNDALENANLRHWD
ncbi:hypothetical protein [Lunatimonas salinarum]|uniref:hypothetical protein n=1 Tax=Lunatimonas salinarum TaxID=1774590 RepID=UPI001ADF4105|nr:hypothetical protein [Lunatimonas salinarum]